MRKTNIICIKKRYSFNHIFLRHTTRRYIFALSTLIVTHDKITFTYIVQLDVKVKSKNVFINDDDVQNFFIFH